MGLSPRLRGNLILNENANLRFGSIPAPAGEPTTGVGGLCLLRVYPRACGGNRFIVYLTVYFTGSIPAPAGEPDASGGSIPAPAGEPDASGGSIPAPAGEPPTETGPASCTWVYPRACGGTRLIARLDQLPSGLSPRLRGNHLIQHAAQPLVRSIPAPAGEPPDPTRGSATRKVYPRACGGTHDTSKSPSMR